MLNPLQRARLSLQGLAVGDAFGETFFTADAEARIRSRTLSPAPWRVTDDTVMALSVVDTLAHCGDIDPEHLLRGFIHRHDTARGYGPSMDRHLTALAHLGPQHWQREAEALFDGHGSFGNGAAMRVAPLGAFFADDLTTIGPHRLLDQARLSAIATHTHPEAVHGAQAVALAAALAWTTRDEPAPAPVAFLTTIAAHLPLGSLRQALEHAANRSPGTTPQQAAAVLGNGKRSSALDTVPFALWSAARFLPDYEQALWNTVAALGDRDTTCAIVGGIVVLRTGLSSIPPAWREHTETLDPSPS